jgi:hypothetical protein
MTRHELSELIAEHRRFSDGMAADENTTVTGDLRARALILAGKRRERIDQFKTAGLAAIQAARVSQPQRQAERAADVAAALAKLRSVTPRQPLDVTRIQDPGQLALLKESRATQDRLDALLQETRRANTLQAFEREPTERLAARVARYAEAAASGDTWPYNGWARDRQALHSTLESRAVKNDDDGRRAQFALQTLDRIEPRLLDRMVPDAPGVDFTEVLDKSYQLLQGLNGDAPDIRPLEQWFGFLARTTVRQVEANGGATWFPKPAPDDE